MAVDALVRAQAHLTPAAVAQELGRWEGRPGTPPAHHAVGLAQEGVDSPMESRTRMRLVLAGLPHPEVQVEVRVGDRRVLLDLGWPDLRVGVEFDGLVHDTLAARSRDTARLTALAAAGWTVLRFRWDDVVHHPERLVAQVRAALAAAQAGVVAA